MQSELELQDSYGALMGSAMQDTVTWFLHNGPATNAMYSNVRSLSRVGGATRILRARERDYLEEIGILPRWEGQGRYSPIYDVTERCLRALRLPAPNLDIHTRQPLSNLDGLERLLRWLDENGSLSFDEYLTLSRASDSAGKRILLEAIRQAFVGRKLEVPPEDPKRYLLRARGRQFLAMFDDATSADIVQWFLKHGPATAVMCSNGTKLYLSDVIEKIRRAVDKGLVESVSRSSEPIFDLTPLGFESLGLGLEPDKPRGGIVDATLWVRLKGPVTSRAYAEELGISTEAAALRILRARRLGFVGVSPASQEGRPEYVLRERGAKLLDMLGF